MRENFDILAYLMGKQAGGQPPGPTPGGFGYTKLAEQDFTVNTSSTTAVEIGTIDCGSSAWTTSKMLYIRVRDTAGVRNGYFYGTDTIIPNATLSPSSLPTRVPIFRGYNSGVRTATKLEMNNNHVGIYVSAFNSSGSTCLVTLSTQYSSSTSNTIDGTYHVEVYLLDWPDGVSPFATS